MNWLKSLFDNEISFNLNSKWYHISTSDQFKLIIFSLIFSKWKNLIYHFDISKCKCENFVHENVFLKNVFHKNVFHNLSINFYLIWLLFLKISMICLLCYCYAMLYLLIQLLFPKVLFLNKFFFIFQIFHSKFFFSLFYVSFLVIINVVCLAAFMCLTMIMWWSWCDCLKSLFDVPFDGDLGCLFSADGPALCRINLLIRSISRIDDVTMVSLFCLSNLV